MRWSILFLIPLSVAAEPVTFNKHIAPLVFQYCSPCHQPLGGAPFPLLTYEDVRRHALQIVAVTARRYMPPWPPDPGYGDFVDERRLTDAELRVIAQWVKEGSPEGEPAAFPTTP